MLSPPPPADTPPSSLPPRLADPPPSRPPRRPSRARKSSEHKAPASPKVFTSFPALASPASATPTPTATPDKPGTLRRAWNGMHRSIMASLASPERSSKEDDDGGVFAGAVEEWADPLEKASESAILRIVERKGGVVGVVRQYSRDLAESNMRVAQERNTKVEILERERVVRDECEGWRRRCGEVEGLLRRVIKPEAPGEVEVVDSPGGLYLLDKESGRIIDLPGVNHSGPNPSTFDIPPTTDSKPPPETRTPDPPKKGSVISQRRASAPKPLMKPKSNDTKPNTRTKPRSNTIATEPDALELNPPILPSDLPPALRPAQNTINGLLVDRLGFLFTAPREPARPLDWPAPDASESDSLDTLSVSDDDFHALLKGLDGPGTRSPDSDGELLCHAPALPVFRFVTSPGSAARLFVDLPKAAPGADGVAIAKIDATTQSTTATAMASLSAVAASIKPADRPADPKNALDLVLAKQNAIFDAHQEKRLAEWLAFAAQLRPGKDGAGVVDDFGVASAARFHNLGALSPDQLKKLRGMIVRGVPVHLRRDIWMEKTGAGTMLEPGLFAALSSSSAPLPAHTETEIEADISRTMGNNVYFRAGAGAAKLRRVLRAYARFDPAIGYSQGLNVIAANLLLMVPEAEDAFWLLVALIEHVLPRAYYAADGAVGATALRADGRILAAYCEELMPALATHIKTHGVVLDMFSPGWFISGFGAALAGEPLFRVWDVLCGFCDGRYLFCVALALLRINRRGLMACADGEALLTYLGDGLTKIGVPVDVLIGEAVGLGRLVTKEDLARRRKAEEEAGGDGEGM
ncbi:TBC-domain-containing protein [Trichodelitschia bisporula]|uniref:TBC-domain-containing protein n=1 Tax=Trichodelitschia bisporula TaxID=703511 RepID=A0A6G1HZB3_9PEZI|nr:TBC-domain-containing protein [Trichodelitschia bisporula]